MQCPACGSESINDDVVFCPHCRYQFRVPEEYAEFVRPDPRPVPRVQASSKNEEKFSRKEILQLKIQLLLPTFIILLSFALFFYTVCWRTNPLSLEISGIELEYGGILCLFIAAIIAWIFYRLMVRKIERT
jgi:hypothetical protein